MNTIYARAVSEDILEELNIYNKVHSTFDKGINIEGKNGLIFIGAERMRVPFGIHLKLEDLRKLKDVTTNDKYRFNLRKKELLLGGYTIALEGADFYSSFIPEFRKKTSIDILKIVLRRTLDLNFDTGFDLPLAEVLFSIDSPIYNLKKHLDSKDEALIEDLLRKLIGRGKGLTPSGDDLLLGLLLVNRMGPVLNSSFMKKLEDLLVGEVLTTRVSVNYYKAGFKGEFSSPMIDLYKGIINEEKENIDKYMTNIINYGHTSGRDTLTGIALGIERLIKIWEEKI